MILTTDRRLVLGKLGFVLGSLVWLPYTPLLLLVPFSIGMAFLFAGPFVLGPLGAFAGFFCYWRAPERDARTLGLFALGWAGSSTLAEFAMLYISQPFAGFNMGGLGG